jgi:hypothetical protein
MAEEVLAGCKRLMERFFFDNRNCGTFIRDEEEFEYANLEAVQVAASKSLAELASEVLPGTANCLMGVDVRNERHEVVLITELTLKAQLQLEIVGIAPQAGVRFSTIANVYRG